jgi:hypothetical protein
MVRREGLAVRKDEATLLVEMLEGNLPFFPTKPAARSLVVAELSSFCATAEQGKWLARRMVQLYPTKWPGLGEMRAVYCSKYRPADGKEASSGVYRDGIPSEEKTPDLARIVGAPAPDIGPPDPVASRLLEDLAKEISDRAEADRAPPRPRLSPRVHPENPITQADVKAAIAAKSPK